jgi:hypothetical protein
LINPVIAVASGGAVVHFVGWRIFFGGFKLVGIAIAILGACIALWPPLSLSFYWLPMSDLWQAFRDSLAATPV